MDYKTKYKSLVEAVKMLKEANPSDEGIQNWVKDNVPELQESEDERIRKDLIGFFKDDAFLCHKNEQIIAWLEKQGEQKSAWSEEDEDMHYKAMAVINRLYAEGKDYVWSTKTLKKLFYWLKSLKDRVKGE